MDPSLSHTRLLKECLPNPAITSATTHTQTQTHRHRHTDTHTHTHTHARIYRGEWRKSACLTVVSAAREVENHSYLSRLKPWDPDWVKSVWNLLFRAGCRTTQPRSRLVLHQIQYQPNGYGYPSPLNQKVPEVGRRHSPACLSTSMDHALTSTRPPTQN